MKDQLYKNIGVVINDTAGDVFNDISYGSIHPLLYYLFNCADKDNLCMSGGGCLTKSEISKCAYFNNNNVKAIYRNINKLDSLGVISLYYKKIYVNPWIYFKKKRESEIYMPDECIEKFMASGYYFGGYKRIEGGVKVELGKRGYGYNIIESWDRIINERFSFSVCYNIIEKCIGALGYNVCETSIVSRELLDDRTYRDGVNELYDKGIVYYVKYSPDKNVYFNPWISYRLGMWGKDMGIPRDVLAHFMNSKYYIPSISNFKIIT